LGCVTNAIQFHQPQLNYKAIPPCQSIQDDEINWDKFTSSPFNEVVVNLFDIVAKNADKNTVQTAATLFINEAKSSLQALHVELCDAMNALGVRFEACGEYEKAVGYFTNVRSIWKQFHADHNFVTWIIGTGSWTIQF
jgi:hypothetical protein